MAKNRVALNRGLDAIFGEVSQAYENNISAYKDSVIELEISEIKPNPYQPRKQFNPSSLQELADSIKQYGLLQPILVYQEEGEYILIAGERRLRASKLAGLEKIRAIVAEIDLSKLREVALIENIQREDLNPIDLAKAYEELIKEYHLTHEALAERVQKSREQISNTLRLLKLSEKLRTFLLEEKITQGHAKILVTLPHAEQEKIANSIIGQKLSVREVENLVRKSKAPLSAKNTQTDKTPSTLEVSPKSLEVLKHYCQNVVLKKEKILLEFSNQTQMQVFLEEIQKIKR